jgi:hypothetical protein
MAAIDFPSGPIIGQQHTEAGKTWEWDGDKWLFASATLEGRHIIVNEAGASQPSQTKLKFERMTVTDDPGNTQTIVTRPPDTFVGTTPPPTPVVGDVWTDSSDTVWKTYLYYDGYWVEKTGTGGSSSQLTNYAKAMAVSYHLNYF